MPNNVFLFTGTSEFLLQKELTHWKSAYASKYGAEGIHVFRHDGLDFSAIQSCILGGGLFSQKSLTILYGIPKDSTKTNQVKADELSKFEKLFTESRDHISSENVVILVSFNPDKRTKLYKFFSQHAQIKQFKKLTGKDLTLFVLNTAKDDGIALGQKEAEYLISCVGDNLYNLRNEVQKLALYCQFNSIEKITQDLISLVCYSQSEFDNFKILDSLVSDPIKALHQIDEAQVSTKDHFQFLGMLYRGLKLMIGMVQLSQQGIGSAKEMASILKVHPFAVNKQFKKLSFFKNNFPLLIGFYKEILALDFSLKTGKVPLESFWGSLKRIVHTLSKNA